VSWSWAVLLRLYNRNLPLAYRGHDMAAPFRQSAMRQIKSESGAPGIAAERPLVAMARVRPVLDPWQWAGNLRFDTRQDFA